MATPIEWITHSLVDNILSTKITRPSVEHLSEYTFTTYASPCIPDTLQDEISKFIDNLHKEPLGRDALESRFYTSAIPKERYLQSFCPSDTIAVVTAHAENNVVAYAELKTTALSSRADFGILVDPKFWNCHIGKNLFYKIYGLALSRKIDDITADVQRSNTRITHLFEDPYYLLTGCQLLFIREREQIHFPVYKQGQQLLYEHLNLPHEPIQQY